MAERRRLYDIYGRPKEARNKYGLIDINGSVSTGSSLFGSNESASNVGGELISIDDFRGATISQDGTNGLVPAPKAGENEYFLQANGGWTYIPAFKWIKEFPEGAGFEKTGVTVNGDLNVKENLTTKNLTVENSAHFFELVVDKVKAAGGQMMISPSLFHVDYVGGIVEWPVFAEDTPQELDLLLYARPDISKMFSACHVKAIKCRRLYMRNDDGSRMTENECQVGDMMRCRSFNIKAQTKYQNVSNKDYWSFVVFVGEEPYTDDNNETHTAFFIDLAYSLRLENGHSLPLGTKLKADGTYEVPAGYTEISDTIGLKSKSNEALTGNPTVDDEFWDNEEFKEITNKVVNIRGFVDQINDIVGS